MHALNGEDEMRFGDRSGPAGGLSTLLADLRGEPIAEVRALALPDWESALLDLRAATFGNRIEAETTCAECGEDSLLVFEIDALPDRAAPPGDGGPGPLSAGDLMDLEASAARGEDALAFLLSRAAGIATEDARARLSGPGRDSLLVALERRVEGLAITLATECAECGAGMSTPFDVAAFVEAEFGTRTSALLDDIHVIATAYHWSEREIAGLPVARRGFYLRRIAADRALAGDPRFGE